MFIRWMGAFDRTYSLEEALDFEFNVSQREVAAEQLIEGISAIDNVKVGLLINKVNIVKSFTGNVWSEETDGVLHPTWNGRWSRSKYRECFAKPIYSGIVIKGRVKNKSISIIKRFAKSNNIKVYYLTKEGLLVKYKGIGSLK